MGNIYDVQMEQLKNRQLADAMLKTGLTPLDPNQTVGSASPDGSHQLVAPLSIAQVLGQLSQVYAGSRLADKGDEAQLKVAAAKDQLSQQQYERWKAINAGQPVGPAPVETPVDTGGDSLVSSGVHRLADAISKWRNPVPQPAAAPAATPDPGMASALAQTAVNQPQQQVPAMPAAPPPTPAAPMPTAPVAAPAPAPAPPATPAITTPAATPGTPYIPPTVQAEFQRAKDSYDYAVSTRDPALVAAAGKELEEKAKLIQPYLSADADLAKPINANGVTQRFDRSTGKMANIGLTEDFGKPAIITPTGAGGPSQIQTNVLTGKREVSNFTPQTPRYVADPLEMAAAPATIKQIQENYDLSKGANTDLGTVARVQHQIDLMKTLPKNQQNFGPQSPFVTRAVNFGQAFGINVDPAMVQKTLSQKQFDIEGQRALLTLYSKTGMSPRGLTAPEIENILTTMPNGASPLQVLQSINDVMKQRANNQLDDAKQTFEAFRGDPRYYKPMYEVFNPERTKTYRQNPQAPGSIQNDADRLLQ